MMVLAQNGTVKNVMVFSNCLCWEKNSIWVGIGNLAFIAATIMNIVQALIRPITCFSDLFKRLMKKFHSLLDV